MYPQNYIDILAKEKHNRDDTTALLGLQLHEMKQHSIHLSCPKLESYAKKHRRILSEYLESHFGCVGKSEGWCRDAAQFLNCSQLEIPFSYLGIPVGVSSKSWVVWQPIIRKFEAKLAKWKQRYLSMGGRITLINSVLTALPIYLLSFFRIPKKVVQKIVTIQRNFL